MTKELENSNHIATKQHIAVCLKLKHISALHYNPTEALHAGMTAFTHTEAVQACFEVVCPGLMFSII